MESGTRVHRVVGEDAADARDVGLARASTANRLAQVARHVGVLGEPGGGAGVSFSNMKDKREIEREQGCREGERRKKGHEKRQAFLESSLSLWCAECARSTSPDVSRSSRCTCRGLAVASRATCDVQTLARSRSRSRSRSRRPARVREGGCDPRGELEGALAEVVLEQRRERVIVVRAAGMHRDRRGLVDRLGLSRVRVDNTFLQVSLAALSRGTSVSRALVRQNRLLEGTPRGAPTLARRFPRRGSRCRRPAQRGGLLWLLFSYN